MSTLDSAAVWSATSLALDETKITAAGLSVRQRKLLALLSQPASLPQLAQRIALPVDDVLVALERFAKLGFAQSSEAVPMSPMAAQLRSSSAIGAPSRTPMLIGIAVAVVAAIGAGAWLLRGGSTSGASAPVASATGNTSVPTATGPGDSADSGLSGAAAKAAAAAAGNTTAAATVRPVVPPPAAAPAPAAAGVAAAAVTAPTKAGTPATGAPTIAAPATNNAPALTLATALPSVPVAAPAAAPAVVAATPAAATAAPAAPAAPAVQTAAPATEVAAATAASASTATAARPAPAASREIKLVNRVEPAFPRGFDADKGTVRARLQVDARGAVTSVDIVEANPPRVFDRTVRSALQQWRYEPTGEAFTVIAEINFSR